MIRHYTPTTDAAVIEHKLLDIYGGGPDHAIAVEIFDAPAARPHPEYGTVGPWIVGPADEVYAYLAEKGWRDFTVQYEWAPVEEDDAPAVEYPDWSVPYLGAPDAGEG